MDLQYNCNNNSNEHGRNDQIVSQFLLKTLHIVLESRVPSIRPKGTLSFGSQVKKSDRWFNLALGERPAALDCLNFWHRNLMEPMIIDIILVQDMPDGSGYGALVETVIERWVVRYEYSKPSQYQSQLHQLSESYKKTYKKSIILLRSLYTMMRLLPAYRAYRKLASKGKACDFDVIYKVSSFSAPFSRSEEQVMKLYSFFPVEAQNGRLLISVRYRESLSEFNLEPSASFPPEIITDYVGSPATDPFRAFPNNKPPPQRPHSWSSGGLFTRANHSSSGRYDLSSSPASSYGQRTQNYRLPTHHSFDESPPFSPSPPMHLSGGGNHMLSRLHSDTAPVSIPNPLFTTPRYLSPNLSDPSRHSLPPLSPRSTRYELSSHESPSAIRSLKKSDMSRVGDLSSGSGSGSTNHKVLRDNKDDSGRFSGLLSSSGSPRVGFSRSSSRLSLQDELDDIDFSCPFIVDDVDTCDSPVSQSGKRSQDAAVGALVRMLRTAPPLRQDSSCCSDHVDAQSNTSGLFLSRKTSDALEDLKAYTGIKHLILSKSKDPTQQHLYTL